MSRFFAILFIIGALIGLVFSSLSTSDFVQHLDREVHAIHCSFVPGLAPTTDAASGCHVALMSPWSSVFRAAVWGGLPVALPGMAVFAFLLFRGVEIWAVRGLSDRAASLFLFVATLLPVFTSVFFAAIAISELGAFCRTCAGIYTASAICLVASIGLVLTTWDTSDPEDDMPPPRPLVSQTAPTERMTRPPKREIREESFAGPAGGESEGLPATESAPGRAAVPEPQPVPSAQEILASIVPARTATQPGFSVDASRVHMEPEAAAEASRIIANMQTSNVEERLARLERQAGATLKLLRQVVDAVRVRPTPKADQS